MGEVAAKCEFYKSKHFKCLVNGQADKGCAAKTDTCVIEWCTHEDSLYKKHDVGIHLECGGGVTEWAICPLKDE